MKKTCVLLVLSVCTMMLNAQTKKDAVLFTGNDMDQSYLLENNTIEVSFSEGVAMLKVGEVEKGTLDLTNGVAAELKTAYVLKANQEPETSNYYTTFFTEGSAFTVPTGVTAYAGVVETTGEDVDKFVMTSVGDIIHAGEPVILKAGENSVTLMPSGNTDKATEPNKLTGTENGIAEAGSNVYALSLGQNGVGFYLWEGGSIGANKAYLELGSNAKPLLFSFDDVTGIDQISTSPITNNGSMFNVNGMRVNGNYKGIVIMNGKKYIVK